MKAVSGVGIVLCLLVVLALPCAATTGNVVAYPNSDSNPNWFYTLTSRSYSIGASDQGWTDFDWVDSSNYTTVQNFGMSDPTLGAGTTRIDKIENYASGYYYDPTYSDYGATLETNVTFAGSGLGWQGVGHPEEVFGYALRLTATWNGPWTTDLQNKVNNITSSYHWTNMQPLGHSGDECDVGGAKTVIYWYAP